MSATTKKRTARQSHRRARSRGNGNCCQERENLLRWAALVESLDEFDRLLAAAEDDEVLDETSAGNVARAVRCLRGELFESIPDRW